MKTAIILSLTNVLLEIGISYAALMIAGFIYFNKIKNKGTTTNLIWQFFVWMFAPAVAIMYLAIALLKHKKAKQKWYVLWYSYLISRFFWGKKPSEHVKKPEENKKE